MKKMKDIKYIILYLVTVPVPVQTFYQITVPVPLVKKFRFLRFPFRFRLQFHNTAF